MKMLFDTNVLVYDTIENSPHHDSASELIDKSADPMINSLSIVELGFVLPQVHPERFKYSFLPLCQVCGRF